MCSGMSHNVEQVEQRDDPFRSASPREQGDDPFRSENMARLIE